MCLVTCGGLKMIIKGVLKEELQNSQRLIDLYKNKLAQLPKGCLVKKNIKGHDYYYLARRNGKKVDFIYLGKLSKEKFKEHSDIRIMRRKYKKLLSDANKQVKFIKGALHGQKATKIVPRNSRKVSK
jgi:hypothetical protein